MNSYRDKYSRLELLVYAISWFLVLQIPLATQTYDVISGEIDTFDFRHVLDVEAILLPIFVLFLLNNFVFMPRLFFNDKKVWYFMVLIACFVVLWYVQTPPEPRHLGHRPEFDNMRPPVDMFHVTNLIIELCVVLANFAIKVYVDSLRSEVMLLNIRNEKMETELESLKYQISPHFLMNSLNNIQSLIEIDPGRAYHTIQSLSRMMRYMLYENANQQVPLQREIDFMTDFIQMMKIRYPDSVQVSAQFPCDCENVKVPPLLFISILENAFKYGVSLRKESFITINLEIEPRRLIFNCINSKNQSDSRRTDADNRKCIGIDNVRRRLQLLYQTNFELKITETDKIFHVEIILPIEAS